MTAGTDPSNDVGLKARVRTRFASPNPLWVREMRQASRLTRTPFILMALSMLLTLLLASASGLSDRQGPARVGTMLFHLYFSAAFFVVSLVGPAIGANTIASEREGKTWQAVLLTGMPAARIAQGKLLAGYTSIATYVVMLAPLGAFPFLFGGVTPLEVFIGFVYLFLLAGLFVAFGIAISSKMESLRSALLSTLLTAVPLSGASFLLVGGLGGELADRGWEMRTRGPAWLAMAYDRAPFDESYLTCLVVIPVVFFVLMGSLLYEITCANLRPASDDRSYGLKRWFAVAAPGVVLLLVLLMRLVGENDDGEASLASLFAFSGFVLFGVFLFAGEDLGPSRRVEKELAARSALRRFFGPGLITSGILQLATLAFGYGALLGSGLVVFDLSSSEIERLLLFSIYAVGFGAFLVGLGAWLRARARQTTFTRVLLLVALFVLTVVPWVVAAVGGLITANPAIDSLAYVVASPSPLYVFVGMKSIGRPSGEAISLVASIAAAGTYLGLGTLLILAAHRRTAAFLRLRRERWRELDARLETEDDEAVAP
ncbi:MAG: ABC transporter permease subunit [Myxococcota bacterium]